MCRTAFLTVVLALSACPLSAAPVPKAEAKPRLFVWVGDTPVLVQPDGKPLDPLDTIPATARAWPGNAKLSPNGQRAAFDGPPDPPAPPPTDPWNGLRGGLRVLTVKPGETPRTFKRLQAWAYFWLDDNRLAVSGCEVSEAGKPSGKLKSWVHDVKADKRTELPLPEDGVLEAVSPDGKTAVVADMSVPADSVRALRLVPLGGGKSELLFHHPVSGIWSPVFSPDGRRLLHRVYDVEVDSTKKVGEEGRVTIRSDRLVIVDVKTKEATTVVDTKDGRQPAEWRWSPDGKRIAVVSEQAGGGRKGRSIDVFVTVADADGKNPKDVFQARDAGVYRTHPGVAVAWAPDGERLAVLRQEDRPERPVKERYGTRVAVMAPDGSNFTEVYKADNPSPVLMGFDWK